MFKLLCVLAVVYLVLKVLNMRARFAEADAKREAEEERARLEAEEAAEEERTRAEAVDVEAETVDPDETEPVIFDVEPEVTEVIEETAEE